MGGTRGSGFVSTTDDVLEMSVVSDVGEMYMCLARSGIGGMGRGEWIGFGFYQLCRNRGVWDVCLVLR